MVKRTITYINPNKKYSNEQLDNINNQYKDIMANDIIGRIGELEEKSVDKGEYSEHKAKCSASFDSMSIEVSLLSRAIFGEPALDNPGIQAMTKEMYKIITENNSKKKVFPSFVSISGGITTIIVMIYATIEAAKKILN